MRSILFSVRSKGLLKYLKRGQNIARSYGLTPSKMVQALDQFSQILQAFQCGATFPATAVAIQRSSKSIEKYAAQGIEFALHGYRHIDLSQLTWEEQVAQLRRAQDVFAAIGIPVTGLRAPYLRSDENLYIAAGEVGLTYGSNQPILWNVLDGEPLSPAAQMAYERAIAFYKPWEANEQPSLPCLRHQLVEIPVSLPDDEMLLDRLGGEANGLVERAWRRILSQTYQRGELFTLQLHPERIAGCADGLSAVLAEARALRPPVWIARLDEIAAWWRARAGANVEVTDAGDGGWRLTVAGPEGTTVLARAVEVDAPTVPWADGYRQVKATAFTIHAPLRPFIGLSPATSPELADFLRQQGYIVEISQESHQYSYYFDQTEFTARQERPLLAQIEGTDGPLVRSGRWPDGARSALAITGDIDALTLWDYGLRFFGR